MIRCFYGRQRGEARHGPAGHGELSGFESVCEAMYLNKPVLMVPTHIEQACNAYDASLSGAGVVADCFDLDVLLSISESHVENPVFRHWVKQADWLILREFREDLLREEHPREDYDKLGGASGEIPAYLGTYSSTVL